MINTKKLEIVYLFLWVLFAFVLPFSKALPNLLLIPILIIFFYLKLYKQLNLTWKNTFLLFIISVIWITLSSFINGGLEDTLKLLSKYYVLIGVYFLVKGVKNNKFYILYGFICGSIVQFLISVYSICKSYLIKGILKLDTGGGINEILNGERPYIGIIMALSILFSLFIIRKLKYNWLYIWVALATGFVFLISARLAMGLCMLILLHHLYEILKHHKIHLFITSILLVIIVTAGLFFNNNFQNRMRISQDFELSYTKFRAYEPRFIIWDCSTEVVLKMNQILGFGSHEDIQTALVSCYETKIPNNQSKKIDYYQRKAFNTHNQFLGFLLLGGWVPCILLVLYFITSFHKSKNVLFSTTLLIFLFFFTFENVLSRQLGILLVGLLMGLLDQNLMLFNENLMGKKHKR